MKLLIDADIVAFRAGFAAEKTKYLVNDQTFDDAKTAKEHAFSNDGLVWSRKEVQPEDQAIMIADTLIKDMAERYGVENPTLHLFLSGVGNYRHSYATRASYKGNRAGSTPPTHLRALRSHLCAKWGASLSVGEEADDLLGIAATENPGSIVCSIDKDLMQLPGRHYNFVTKEEVTVSRKEADLNFYAQVLSGDSTDNVPGVTGIGPAKARKILDGAKGGFDCWKRIVDVYYNEFKERGEAYALEAARLVYVRRTVGEMWSPPLAKEQKRVA